ncbi:hypothetical protein HMPREF9306_01811 [Propionimicrobium lymphophilum ACS-093-V-SCH5]|uniref:BMC domain-containing protein n=1 Tax=Propionimicrobium lymphophilum ACS-093-V-SCH5 TaxID=883161 RepID=S2WI25_9ACTN|nr:BMC domain-containing protein [Propionimicrobium lymphophilum]EPD32242.1 hypothetical protein HMPREF9306_01811 [Propionimicrobium lymphophilum ACS-093-V-SCH5]
MQALGTIETLGMVAAIAAADAAAKAANVELIGYELTRGGGYVNVKVQGAVDAVQSSMDAAKMAAERISKVISLSVIARPSSQMEKIIFSADTVGAGAPEPQKAQETKETKAPQQAKVAAPKAPAAKASTTKAVATKTESITTSAAKPELQKAPAVKAEAPKTEKLKSESKPNSQPAKSESGEKATTKASTQQPKAAPVKKETATSRPAAKNNHATRKVAAKK